MNNILPTEENEGPIDLINIEGTNEQIVQTEQNDTQITEANSVDNKKISVCLLTRSMAAKLTAASASECLFADFLEIEPKKVSEALKHPEWVYVMQEELNQKQSLESCSCPQEESQSLALNGMKSMRIFLAFATYMNFNIFQMDVKSAFLNENFKEVYVQQPPGFEM
ncbi:retrovirus-related pol polyprotein from transposon TNT 1-94 [Tanacetum coccineum]